jgi:SAM-dependent methyltransferase
MRDAKNPEDPVSRILDLSRRVSVFSPAMKPFVRFASRQRGHGFCHRHLWDFDDLLQKKLLALLRQTASPEGIARACTEQWKRNSEMLLRQKRQQLEQGISGVDEPHYALVRRMILQEHLERNSLVLYMGCGTGRDCLAWAKDGLRIVGIDTDTALVRFAREWNDRLRYPATFAGMDMMHLGLRSRSVDGFLLELYGGLPDMKLVFALQRELNRVLRSDGVGLVVAERKMYSCWWFLMPTSWPDSMVKWLQGQVRLDFCFGNKDACEERLQYGLFSRCHTVESLSAELSRTFEVISCRYQTDPRYVLAVVRKRAGVLKKEMEEESTRPVTAPVDLSAIERTLENAEALCEALERHAERVASFFDAGGQGARCLSELRTGAEPILSRLEHLAGRDGASTESVLSDVRGTLSQKPGKGSRSDARLG